VLTLSNQARMRLMAATLVVSLPAAALLLGYASFLSFRIGRLARAAETALAPSGELTTRLPGARSGDEIGDLSRSFGDLLDRLGAYTDYLRTLTGKLAHEIRTPIAIVSTSLENLQHGSDDAAVYLERMRQGTARLDAILSAMSAATRVEQAVAEAPAESYDLGAIVRSCTEAYRSVYPERTFALTAPQQSMPVFGSSDLLAQLLDKLVDNAVGFSEPGSEIGIAVAVAGDAFELTVTNEGPPLPASMRHQLFDSLVSIRAHKDGGTHLGLGLYIVTLVAKFHRGTVEARDRDDAKGVVIVVRLPRHSR
jgi:signal transduction histidine kinase